MRRMWMSGKLLFAAQCLERLDTVSKPVFVCNICNRPIRHPIDGPAHSSAVFERLRVAGGGFRKKEQCPLCLSNDRVRFVAEVLRRYTDILSRPCRVLEFAPMACLERFLRQWGHCDYLSGDIQPGRAMRVMDITRIDAPDATFDYVLCNHVLEHVDDEARAIGEMLRVTKPGGCLLLSMPVALALAHTLEDASADTPQKRLAAYGQKDHVRLYGRDVRARLARYGLDAREIVAGESMPDAVRLYGLIAEDRNYLCHRA